MIRWLLIVAVALAFQIGYRFAAGADLPTSQRFVSPRGFAPPASPTKLPTAQKKRKPKPTVVLPKPRPVVESPQPPDTTAEWTLIERYGEWTPQWAPTQTWMKPALQD